jgi:hypothetical protein
MLGKQWLSVVTVPVVAPEAAVAVVVVLASVSDVACMAVVVSVVVHAAY